MALPADWKEGRSLEWITELPCSDRHRESPVFMLQDTECYFQFTRTWDTGCGCSYLIHLKQKKKPIRFRTFRVTVFAGFKKGIDTDVFETSSCCISDLSQSVWWIHQSTIEPRMKLDFTHGSALRFVFVFDSVAKPELPKLQICKTVSKCVQTSASYFNADPCLESLSQDFHRLLNSGSDHDAVLKCGDHTMRAHRSVLCTRSGVFEAMLHSDMVEGRTGLVELQDMDAAIFQEFVRYLYTGTMPELTADRAKKFYEAGDQYAVKSLVRLCANFLTENLTLHNAYEYLVLADAHSDQCFKDSVIFYILDKKLPFSDSRWPAFCDGHPKVANEVLNRALKLQCPV